MNLRDLFHAAPGNALTVAELRPYVSNHQLAKLVGNGAIQYNGRGVYRLKLAPADLALAKVHIVRSALERRLSRPS